MNQLPNIAIVGNAPESKCQLLNDLLQGEDLANLCTINLYGADGQPEMEALTDALHDYDQGMLQGIVMLPFQSSPAAAVNAVLDADNASDEEQTANEPTAETEIETTTETTAETEPTTEAQQTAGTEPQSTSEAQPSDPASDADTYAQEAGPKPANPDAETEAKSEETKPEAKPARPRAFALLHIDGLHIYPLHHTDSETDDYAVVTQSELTEAIEKVNDTLRRHFFIRHPRIAVTALSQPKVSQEDEEEQATVREAVKQASDKGLLAIGPVNAQDLSLPAFNEAYDAVIVPTVRQAVECTGGSLDEAVTLISGTQRFIASATYEQVLQAVYTVIDIKRNKAIYERPFAHPLPKLYHERREDGDKARFAVKRKGGFNPAEHKRENVNYTSGKRTPIPVNKANQQEKSE